VRARQEFRPRVDDVLLKASYRVLAPMKLAVLIE